MSYGTECGLSWWMLRLNLRIVYTSLLWTFCKRHVQMAGIFRRSELLILGFRPVKQDQQSYGCSPCGLCHHPVSLPHWETDSFRIPCPCKSSVVISFTYLYDLWKSNGIILDHVLIYLLFQIRYDRFFRQGTCSALWNMADPVGSYRTLWHPQW